MYLSTRPRLEAWESHISMFQDELDQTNGCKMITTTFYFYQVVLFLVMEIHVEVSIYHIVSQVNPSHPKQKKVLDKAEKKGYWYQASITNYVHVQMRYSIGIGSPRLI